LVRILAEQKAKVPILICFEAIVVGYYAGDFCTFSLPGNLQQLLEYVVDLIPYRLE
jgi:hypothetical protein